MRTSVLSKAALALLLGLLLLPVERVTAGGPEKAASHASGAKAAGGAKGAPGKEADAAWDEWLKIRAAEPPYVHPSGKSLGDAKTVALRDAALRLVDAFRMDTQKVLVFETKSAEDLFFEKYLASPKLEEEARAAYLTHVTGSWQEALLRLQNERLRRLAELDDFLRKSFAHEVPPPIGHAIWEQWIGSLEKMLERRAELVRAAWPPPHQFDAKAFDKQWQQRKAAFHPLYVNEDPLLSPKSLTALAGDDLLREVRGRLGHLDTAAKATANPVTLESIASEKRALLALLPPVHQAQMGKLDVRAWMSREGKDLEQAVAALTPEAALQLRKHVDVAKEAIFFQSDPARERVLTALMIYHPASLRGVAQWLAGASLDELRAWIPKLTPGEVARLRQLFLQLNPANAEDRELLARGRAFVEELGRLRPTETIAGVQLEAAFAKVQTAHDNAAADPNPLMKGDWDKEIASAEAKLAAAEKKAFSHVAGLPTDLVKDEPGAPPYTPKASLPPLLEKLKGSPAAFVGKFCSPKTQASWHKSALEALPEHQPGGGKLAGLLSPDELVKAWSAEDKWARDEKAWRAVREELAKDPARKKAVDAEVAKQMEKARAEFLKATQKVDPWAKYSAPWLFEPDNPWFTQEIEIDPTGAPRVVFAPTPKLRELQYAQALFAGLHYFTGNPEKSAQVYRTIPFSVPRTPLEAMQWFAAFGKDDPCAMTKMHTGGSLKSADFDLLLITPMGSISQFTRMGVVEFLARSAAMIAENLAIYGGVEAISQKGGPLDGFGPGLYLVYAVGRGPLLAGLSTAGNLLREPAVAAAARVQGALLGGLRAAIARLGGPPLLSADALAEHLASRGVALTHATALELAEGIAAVRPGLSPAQVAHVVESIREWQAGLLAPGLRGPWSLPPLPGVQPGPAAVVAARAAAPSVTSGAAKYAVKEIRPQYAGPGGMDHVPGGIIGGNTVVADHYLHDEAARRPFLVTIENGRLMYQGHPLTTTTTNGIFQHTPDYWIFVMDEAGQIYAAPGRPGLMHHSTFLAGGPIAAGGEISVVDGLVMAVNNASGHYYPGENLLNQFLHRLHASGVNLRGGVHTVDPRGITYWHFMP